MICTFCQSKVATEMHHYFPNTKTNRKKYGTKLIEDPRNKTPACNDCNGSHRKATNWKEKKFCKVMEILDCYYCRERLFKGCLWNQEGNAEDCRFYQFERNKYYKQKENEL